MKVFPKQVIQNIKDKSGLSFRQSKDYATLSTLIYNETNERISDNTLRRLMGVKKDGGEARRVTLDIIAQYLGSPTWEEYQDEISDSRFCDKLLEICSKDLALGQHVEVHYSPNRILKLQLVAPETFKVEACSSKNLQVGDLLKIQSFIETKALFVSQVVRDGRSIGQYIAGEVGGVEKILL